MKFFTILVILLSSLAPAHVMAHPDASEETSCGIPEFVQRYARSWHDVIVEKECHRYRLVVSERSKMHIDPLVRYQEIVIHRHRGMAEEECTNNNGYFYTDPMGGVCYWVVQ